MKRTFLLIPLILLVTFQLYSQVTLKQYTLKSNLEYARSQAEAAGYIDPVFVAAFAQNNTIQYQGINFKVTYNLEEGTSDAWIYGFRAKDIPEQLIALLVVETSFGKQAINIPLENITASGYSTFGNLDDYNLDDSDEIASLMQKDQSFNQYYESNKPFDQLTVAIFVSAPSPLFIENEPYWAFIMEKNNNIKTCGIHVVSKEVVCSLTDIKDNSINSNINVYPSPADDYVEITDINSNMNISIYDIYGRAIDNAPYTFNSSGININLQNVSSGIYFLKTNNRNIMFIKK